MATDAPVKFSVLKLRNLSGRPRRLSATAYCEWVLGDLRPKSLMYVTTELDPRTGAVFARNPGATDFAGRVAFLDASDTARNLTGDRTEFLGRNGTAARPAAMTRDRLSGRLGAALDPCAAMQVPFDLAAGQQHEICFILGIGRDADEARGLIQRFRGSTKARCRSRVGVAVLESHSGCGQRRHARRLGELPGQRLASVPDPGLPRLGAQWLSTSPAGPSGSETSFRT